MTPPFRFPNTRCFVYNDAVISYFTGVTPLGTSRAAWTIPEDPRVVAFSLFVQWAVIESPSFLATTNSLRLLRYRWTRAPSSGWSTPLVPLWVLLAALCAVASGCRTCGHAFSSHRGLRSVKSGRSTGKGLTGTEGLTAGARPRVRFDSVWNTDRTGIGVPSATGFAVPVTRLGP